MNLFFMNPAKIVPLCTIFAITAVTILPILEAEEEVKAPTTQTTFKVTTYNVLADSKLASKRTAPLLALLKESNADVIALQEVTPWFLKQLKSQPWIKDHTLTETPKGVIPGGLLFISKWPIVNQSIKALPSFQSRCVLTAHIKVNDHKIMFANVHLESPLKSHKMRLLQMNACMKLLKPSKDIFWVGDFNFGDHDKPEVEKPKLNFIDAGRF